MPDFSINSEEIGNRIRVIRKKQKKTQAYYADLLYISPSYLALIESGKRTPTVDVLAQISKVSDVSVDYLLFGEAPNCFDKNEKTFRRLQEEHSSEDVAKALKLAEFYLSMNSNE